VSDQDNVATADASTTRRQLFVAASGTVFGSAVITAATIFKPRSAQANDAFVDTSSNQTIDGVKTFIRAPVVPAAAFPQEAVAGLVTELASKEPAIPPGTYLNGSTAQTVASTFSLTHAQGGTVAAPVDASPFKFQPTDLTKGAFTLRIYGGRVNSTWDSIFALGYNSDGSRTGEPSLELCIEQDYEAAPGQHFMEMYWQYAPADRSRFLRPFFVSVNRDTHVIYTAIAATTSILFQEASQAATTWMAYSAQGMTMALPGQRLEFNAHGSVVFSTVHGTSILTTASSARNVFYRASAHVFQSTAGTTVLQLSATTGPVSTLIAPGNGSTISVVRQGPGRQFFAMQEWQTEAAAVLAKIDRSGYFMTRKATAPIDADIVSSEGTFWWKDTPGAAGVQWKGKDAHGNVATLNLARQAPQPDTSGATLAKLEDEVNGIKMTLRTIGILP
jgi:hypothetical protein